MAEPLSKLARQLAKGASTKSGLFGGKTSEFYHEVCDELAMRFEVMASIEHLAWQCLIRL